MGTEKFPKIIQENFELHEWRHATAILQHDFPNEFDDLVKVLSKFKLHKSWLSEGGGNKSMLAKWIDHEFRGLGWMPKNFDTKISVDDALLESPTHEIDCFKNRVALELEWNNKDPFYDRDLNNFRLLFDLRAISIGVILTRCDDLQEIFNELGRGSSYGNSTTHMSKLLPRIKGGGGAGGPLLVFGMRKALYDPNS